MKKASWLFISIIGVLVSGISGYFIIRNNGVLPDSKFDANDTNNAKTVDILIVCVFFVAFFITLYGWYSAVVLKDTKIIEVDKKDMRDNILLLGALQKSKMKKGPNQPK